ncbi:MAG: hypothetical protein ACO1SV_22510 [Fimbriimonas sp.]
MPRAKLDKPKPIDYAVMFGGPILFLLIAFFGIRTFVGPPPPVQVVQRLRDGAVKVGMTEAEVLATVGEPKGTIEKSDGGFTYRYQRSAWDSARSTFLEEDAYIEFSSSGTVTGINFDSRVPPR